MMKDGQVVSVIINKQEKIDRGTWIPADSQIVITYYEAETLEEVAAAHPGQLRVPESSKRCIGRNFRDIITSFENAGFTKILTEEQVKTKKDWFAKEGSIARISINGQTQFDKGEWFDEKSVIRITYLVLSNAET